LERVLKRAAWLILDACVHEKELLPHRALGRYAWFRTVREAYEVNLPKEE